MWLLNTRTADLRHFSGPHAVPGGYAILSHVWAKTEDSFHPTPQEPASLPRWYNVVFSVFSWLLRLLSFGVLKARPSPRDRFTPKVRGFLKLAEKQGYEWAWVDTCCIDKTSSAEVTEAINSMFRYYALADVCYAYLRDVPADDPGAAHFFGSRWHTRSWTLQELVAPTRVVFLAEDWSPIGTRFEMADQLQKITGIPAAVLRLEQDVHQVSVAARMSWAAQRKATRVEDKAYSLFGLFGINLPTLYGESEESAFYRLQEEIMSKSVDTSMVMWGDVLQDVGSAEEIARLANEPIPELGWPQYEHLLAPMVGCFRDSQHTRYHTVGVATSTALDQVRCPPLLLLTKVNLTRDIDLCHFPNG
ncbi:uncharacterized protein BXZ73DRAFT_38511 [Epithele typhae]|uniref:uncharacterized protein n=1 Tax=Epithele typhae TaxID=378194 RepID=UPI002008A439|nr:uncharacterized protein BXZ73DRAFT_38511 [Epithele typhae]KAH9945262.1 hypothetical protein BXZ73DRAFT_38511 [Epithele typhae]